MSDLKFNPESLIEVARSLHDARVALRKLGHAIAAGNNQATTLIAIAGEVAGDALPGHGAAKFRVALSQIEEGLSALSRQMQDAANVAVHAREAATEGEAKRKAARTKLGI